MIKQADIRKLAESGAIVGPVAHVLPTPYYEQDGITIYHGDCREVLPGIYADITVSSPPYNLLKKQHSSGMWAEARCKRNEGYESHDDQMPESEYQEWMRDVFGCCLRQCKGIVWINHKTRYRDKRGIHPLHIFPWQFHSEIIWSRPGSIMLNAKRHAVSHEHIYGFGDPHFWDRCNDSKMTVWSLSPAKHETHPCPFPIEIPKRLIASSCPMNGVVVDPFMGIGTTLRAAKDLGRKAIGIEIEEKYCEIAANRLAQGVLQFTD